MMGRMKHSLHRKTLENGMNLLIIDVPESRHMDVAIVVKAGYRIAANSESTPPEVPHLLEHMVFDGSSHYPTSDDLQEVFTTSGGEWNGVTTPYSTMFVFQNKPKNADTLLDAALDMIYRPTLNEQSFDEELQVVANELGEKMGDFALNADLYTQQLALPGFLVSTDLMLGSLETTTYEDVVTFHREYYTTRNTVVAIACDLSQLPLTAITDILTRKTKGVKKGIERQIPRFTVNSDKNRTSQFIKISRSIKTSTLALSYVVPATFEDAHQSTADAIKTELFARMVSNMKSYSVQHRLRKQGLAYGISFSGARSVETQGFEFMIEAPNDRFSDVLTQTLSMTIELAKSGITEAQFNALKEEVIDSYDDRITSPHDVLPWYLDEYLIEGTLTEVSTYKKAAKAITQADVLEFARTILQHEHQYATVFSNKAIRTSVNVDIITVDIFAGKTPVTVKEAFNEEVDKYYEPDPEAGFFRRIAIFINTRPWLAWTGIILQILFGIGLWFLGAHIRAQPDHPWWYLLLIIAGALCISEALGDIIIRRRRYKNRQK